MKGGASLMKNDMLFESELKVLKILWDQGDTIAKELAIHLKESTAWSKTTSYTMIKRCIEKGLIERSGTNFMCRAILTKEEAKQLESEVLIEKMFDGSPDLLISYLLGKERLTTSQIGTLRILVQEFVGE